LNRSRAIALAAFGVILVAVVVIVLVGQGGGEDSGSGGGEATATDTLGEKPEVTVPDQPATELVTEDIVEGDGAEAKQGDTVEVEYVGVAQSTGTEFDSSWERDEPFSFELGAGEVIPGWDQGIEGMKEGGRRLLVIPGDLAYGPTGQPPDIGPDETLVFAVDLLEVK
jgi:peptidylprolyl isomerase